MTNQTLRKFALSFLGFAAVGALAAPSPSFAWGHLSSLSTDDVRANLIYQIIREPEIRYCLEITSANYSQRSLEAQLEHALRVWLKPIQKAKLVGKVTIRQVSCNSTDYILKVTLSGEADSRLKNHAAYHLPKKNQDHYYSFIRINTENPFKDPLNPTSMTRWTDFGSFNLGNMAAMDRLNWLEKRRPIIQSGDLSSYGNFGGEDLVFNSTYRVIVHELGHAFGLCDLYDRALNCDSVWISEEHNTAIMQSGPMLLPTADDQRGLSEVVKRLKADMQGKVYASPFVMKPRPK